MREVPAVPGTLALTSLVALAFDADGPIARAIPEFEPRPGQLGMAMAVARLFVEGGRLLVEAGTGTGKTLAYLVPAVLSRQRVLVSTGTKNLQEQIYFKDLPALAGALGVPFTATCMKGRNNYLCLQRLESVCGSMSARSVRESWGSHDAERAGEGHPKHTDGQVRSRGRSLGVKGRRKRRHASAAPTGAASWGGDPFVAMIVDWARQTETGDRAELADLPEELPVWNELAATSDGCLGSTCPHYDDCFVTRMRQRAAASDIVIVNHHLLCADAAVRQDAYGEVIPACAHAVIDEAHQLEDVATQYFGVAVSNYRIEDLCHDAEQVIAARGMDIDRVDLGQCVEHVRDRGRAFFIALQFGRLALDAPEGGRARFRRLQQPPADGSAGGEERTRLTSDVIVAVRDASQELSGALERLEGAFLAVKQPSDDGSAIGRRAGEIRGDLAFVLHGNDPDFVYYLESRGRGVFLRASPIDVSNIVRTQLLERFHAVALTSATLSVAGSFEYIRGRLGLKPSAELRLTSEFDYTEQALLYLPARMPDPRSRLFVEAAAREIVEIVSRTRGRAFVLFTSYSVLRGVQPFVEEAVEYPVLVQGSAPRSVLLQQFRTTPNAVLLATSSFWQGVDVVGEALSCVIVDKLPFASPADPLTAARMDAIARSGGEPFWDYEVPLAILTLQQGLGRLLRHRRDRGVLSVLDPRLRTKAYGAAFLGALPPAPVTDSLDAVRRFFERP